MLYNFPIHLHNQTRNFSSLNFVFFFNINIFITHLSLKDNTLNLDYITINLHVKNYHKDYIVVKADNIDTFNFYEQFP